MTFLPYPGAYTPGYKQVAPPGLLNAAPKRWVTLGLPGEWKAQYDTIVRMIFVYTQ